MRRQLRLQRVSRAGDERPQTLANLLQIAAPVGHHAVAPFEPETEHAIQDFEDIDVLLGIGRHPADQQEELFAAVDFALERDKQAPRGPYAASAPAGAVGRLVERSAQTVSDDRHVLPRQIDLVAYLLEQVDLAHEQRPQTLHRFGRFERRRHVGEHSEQRARRLEQRIRGCPHLVETLLNIHDCIELARIDGRARGTPFVSGAFLLRIEHRPGITREKVERVFIERTGVHLWRTPQSSSFNSGKWPAMCIASPPCCAICSQNGPLRDNS